MDDILFVEEFEGQQCLTDDLDSLIFCENASIEDWIEILTHEVLLYNEEVQSILEDIEHSNDVRVPCIHQHFELVHKKIIKSRLLAEQVLFEDLECEDSLFACFIDGACIFRLHLLDLFIA